jgi:hypothetical protein
MIISAVPERDSTDAERIAEHSFYSNVSVACKMIFTGLNRDMY